MKKSIAALAVAASMNTHTVDLTSAPSFQRYNRGEPWKGKGKRKMGRVK